jgi:hypothetical protein
VLGGEQDVRESRWQVVDQCEWAAADHADRGVRQPRERVQERRGLAVDHGLARRRRERDQRPVEIEREHEMC